MRITIDAAGRVVVPKALRDELGFAAGQELEAVAVDGRLEISSPPANMWLERHGGDLVARSTRPMAPLSAQEVRETLERIRR